MDFGAFDLGAMDIGAVVTLIGGLVFLGLVVLAIRKMATKQIGAGDSDGDAEEEALAREALGVPDAPIGALPPGHPEAQDQPTESATAKPISPTPAASAEGRRPMRKGLEKTRKGFMAQINQLLFKALDENLVDDLESIMITSDIGIRTTERVLEDLRGQLSRKEIRDPSVVRARLEARVRELLGPPAAPLAWQHEPTVMMVIGVNGVGKTTTIGKLAARLVQDGKKVVLAAGDTFRAAAVEQLEIWGDRSGALVVRGPEGADPSSVIYEAIQKARSIGAHACICDTAGRLHTKVNLMEELKKLRRVMNKAQAGAPHEVMMVLDATTGQNAIAQARQFKEAVEVNSIALTKLDGTAKGGVVVAICDELGLPVRYVGIGEKVEDLRDFDPDEFVEALFATPEAEPQMANAN
ncbi:MAG: signal recognition particle-docking protein FtsY [Deltaproteobacteria bacterium]|nr:signal recognition particle-docking protein FtsY [Deltaproteobacteria bacterium]